MSQAEGSGRIGAVGLVRSVNVGTPREVERNGRPAETAIWKAPVSGRVGARGVNLDGDDQADRKAHGGPDKAVYAYAVEDTRWWEAELGGSIDVGGFGENLTIEGLDLTEAVVGEQWQVGTARLEVSEPRLPCWRLNLRMDDSTFVRRFAAAGRPGAYLRIVAEGDVGAGDEIRIGAVPAHGLTVGDVARIYHHDRRSARQLVDVAELSQAWQGWAERTLERLDKRGERGEPCPGCS